MHSSGKLKLLLSTVTILAFFDRGHSINIPPGLGQGGVTPGLAQTAATAGAAQGATPSPGPEIHLPAGAAEGATPAAPVQGETPPPPAQIATPAAPAQGGITAVPVEAATPAAPVQTATPAVPAQEATTPAVPAQGEIPAGPAQGAAPAVPPQGAASPGPTQAAVPPGSAQGTTPPGPEIHLPAGPAEGATPAAPVQGETPPLPAPAVTPEVPAQGGIPAGPAEVAIPAAPIQAATPAVTAQAATTAMPAQGGIPAGPAIPASLPPPSTTTPPRPPPLSSRNYRSKRGDVVRALLLSGKSWVADVIPEFEALNLTDFGTLCGGDHVDEKTGSLTIVKHPPRSRRVPQKCGEQGTWTAVWTWITSWIWKPGPGQGSGWPRRKRQAALPSTYDVRTVWPMCKSLDSIRNQFKCSSCWAVTVASLMSDRHCLYNFNTVGQIYVSPMNIISCIPKGCDGGMEWDAYNYWILNGLVTGGTGYTPAAQPDGCLPYPTGIDKTPAMCPSACSTTSYSKTFDDDKIYGGQWYNWWFPSAEQIQQEIYSYGPVAAFFTVYEDFFYYKGGVYDHAYGDQVGYHLTKLIGWGTENGIDYWQAVNTWGTTWGENGLFKIRRGNNTVGIETRVSTVVPREAF